MKTNKLSTVFPSTALVWHTKTNSRISTKEKEALRLGALSFWPHNYTLPALVSNGNLDAVADADTYQQWLLDAVRSKVNNIKVHCIDAVRDCDKRGWMYMEKAFSMIGVGYGCIPRGVFRGTVMTYHEKQTHLVVARYSSMWGDLCAASNVIKKK